MKYLNLASRIFNKPLMVEQNYLATFVAAFANQDPSVELTKIEMPNGTDLTPEQAMRDSPIRRQVVGYQILDGVAVIPVSGTLVNKGSYLPTASGMQGYNGILAMFSEALDDPAVESILFDINSPGGEVAGCFDLCRLVAASREEKPIAAFVGEQATSAAYALASAAETVYTPDTGILGSVGVVVAHQDFSKRLKDQGVKVTLIHSGQHKVDGNPFESLSDSVRENIQGRIDSTRQKFAELVAYNRGMSVEAVLATEAQTYEGEQAVEIGLADKIMSFNEVIETMSKKNDDGVTPVSTVSSMEDDKTKQVASEQEPVEKADDASTQPTAGQVDILSPALDALAVTKLCDDANAGHLVGHFIKKQATEQQVTDSLAQLEELRGKLKAAELTDAQIASVEVHFENPAALAAAVIQATAVEDADIRSAITPRGGKSQEAVDFYDFQNQ